MWQFKYKTLFTQIMYWWEKGGNFSPKWGYLQADIITLEAIDVFFGLGSF